MPTWKLDSDVSRVLYIGIVVAAALAMAVLFVMIQNDRHDLTREASIRATQIQQQRYDATYRACIDQNQRYDHTIAQLKHILKDYIKAHPEKAAQAKSSISQNELLIGALAPKRNCKTVAQKAVHPLANPNGR